MSKQYIAGEDLKIGDNVCLLDGVLYKCQNIDIELEKKVDEIVKMYHEKIHKLRSKNGIIYANPTARKKIKNRLNEFSFEEIKNAMYNFSQDDWWMKNNAIRGLTWFFAKYDRIEMLINLKPKEEETGFKIGNKIYKNVEEIKSAEFKGEIYYDTKSGQYYPTTQQISS